MSEEQIKASILLKNSLGVMDISQIEELNRLEEAMEDKDFQNRANDAQLFYRTYFKQVLSTMILAQLKVIGIGAEIDGQKIIIENDKQLAFARGYLIGLDALRKWFEEQETMALVRFDKKDEPTSGEAIEPVGRIKT